MGLGREKAVDMNCRAVDMHSWAVDCQAGPGGRDCGSTRVGLVKIRAAPGRDWGWTATRQRRNGKSLEED